ncbi:DUF3124 domain-containing protein [Desulfovibrio sulfodismutans]|uniref:DUF3124 domain-containing protein n=1 Tax=Desulfolutivibrio sulfodismutans TaxID=63561 RepID=A0A7K3NHI6_9BACT|nr:DUF3124 domain-containing protein [Desulfolutivibrio sulfodismutans]NDY55664.1 DUF3124 domain-containing protein [Desulfolutivibrio sulfodismutans]QLA13691.1 DUF3124 domain-containing protein [Desulfolutivibrio sulfodismutans DSM 3696]
MARGIVGRMLCAAALFAALAGAARAGGPGGALLSKGQTIYVPVYSHIYHGIKARPFNLTVTVSVRNTDPRRPLTVLAADYYDTEGGLVRHFLDKPATLPPLATREFIVEERDEAGGSGANCIVRWSAAEPVNAPVVEAVMIGASSNQGISFVCTGRVIEE